MNIGFIIGWVLGLIIFFSLKTWLEIRFENRKQRWVKALSPDKKAESFRGGYILYANNSRWYLENFITWKLIWLPKSGGDDVNKILDSNWQRIEFQSTWLPEYKMYKMVRRIIFTHPNLEAKGLWKIIKLFR